MIMIKKYITLLLLTVLFAPQVRAQVGFSSLQYSVGFATGDFNKFISQESFRGATFEWRKFVTDNVGVGFELGWNAFYEELDYATYTEGTQSISGKQFRYGSVVPVLVAANYYFKAGEALNPFVGLGVGTQYSRTDLDMGIFTQQDEVWHFAVKPELGVIIKPRVDFGFIIAAKYYNAFKTKEVDTRSYFAANIGFVWEY